MIAEGWLRQLQCKVVAALSHGVGSRDARQYASAEALGDIQTTGRVSARTDGASGVVSLRVSPLGVRTKVLRRLLMKAVIPPS